MEVVEFSCLPNCTGRWTQKCYELFIKICITEWQNKYAKYLVPINVCVYIIQHTNPFHNNNNINTIIIIILLSSWTFARITFRSVSSGSYFIILHCLLYKLSEEGTLGWCELFSLTRSFDLHSSNLFDDATTTVAAAAAAVVLSCFRPIHWCIPPLPPLNHPPTVTPGRARCYGAHAHRETAVN